MGQLRDAIANWIRAEYQFRFGPNAYRGNTDQWFLGACDKLREALTGSKDVVDAARALGVDVMEPPPLAKRGIPAKQPLPEEPQKAKIVRKRLSLWE